MRFRSRRTAGLLGLLTSAILLPASLTFLDEDAATNTAADGGAAEGVAGAYACRQYLDLPPDSHLPPEANKWRVHSGTLAEAPNGDLLYAFYGGSREGAADQNIYLARLRSGAQEWEAPELLFDEPGKADGNPVLWTDGTTVRLFFVTIFGHGWEEASIRTIHSDDNGGSWSEPEWVRKEWGWMTGTRPFRMSNGEFLLPVYDEAESSSGFLVFDEDLESWRAYPTAHNRWLRSPNGSIQPTVVELEPGHLLAYMRTGDGDVFRSQSFDYGRHWSEPERSELGNPDSRLALLKLSTGPLVVAYNPWIEHRSPLRFSMSTHPTKTWTPPWSYTVDVENRDGPQFTYPYLIEADDGFIHLAYSANRDTMAHVVVNEEYLRSGVSVFSRTDGATTEYRNGQVRAVDQCSYRMGDGS